MKIILSAFLLVLSLAANAKNDKPRRDVFMDSSFGSKQSYLVYYITPNHKKLAIEATNNAVTKKLNKLSPTKLNKMKMLYGGAKYSYVKAQTWDNSNQVLVLAVPDRPAYALDSQYTANANRYPISSVTLVNENFETVCEALSLRNLLMTPEIVSYVDDVYHNHAKGILELDFTAQIDVNAKIAEFSPQCFNTDETLMVLIKAPPSKSTKATVKKQLKQYIVKEFSL